ncbi:17.8 kDa class I heat shock protein [Glycine soja]|uniref:17.8 kDa class I heat shock protein n=1 Tax=Glycine soja TaxID=3848 RepID=A0A0B2P7D7_GLYSO|nr:17.8 kDa class I heat shock protein [Glycine soja]
MSLLSSGGFFGRRRNEPPPHQPTWDPYQAQEHHPPPFMSPVLDTFHIEWKETPEAVEKEEQREGWHRVELSNGQFVQRLTLPENSMVDLVKAYMDNGVLTINVPKKHHRGVNNRVRNINISSRP